MEAAILLARAGREKHQRWPGGAFHKIRPQASTAMLIGATALILAWKPANRTS